MKLNDKPARTVMLLILFGVVLNAAVQNLNVVGRALDVLLGVISPLLLGLLLAGIACLFCTPSSPSSPPVSLIKGNSPCATTRIS